MTWSDPFVGAYVDWIALAIDPDAARKDTVYLFGNQIDDRFGNIVVHEDVEGSDIERKRKPLQVSRNGGADFAPPVFDRSPRYVEYKGVPVGASVLRNGTALVLYAGQHEHTHPDVEGPVTGYLIGRTRDGGRTLEVTPEIPAIGALHGPTSGPNGYSMDAAFAVDQSGGAREGRMYVIYPRQVGSRFGLIATHSDDQGESWSTPDSAFIPLGATPEVLAALPSAAVNNDGVLAVLWARPAAAEMYLSVSLDGGRTFEPPTLVSRGSLNGPGNPQEAIRHVRHQSYMTLVSDAQDSFSEWDEARARMRTHPHTDVAIKIDRGELYSHSAIVSDPLGRFHAFWTERDGAGMTRTLTSRISVDPDRAAHKLSPSPKRAVARENPAHASPRLGVYQRVFEADPGSDARLAGMKDVSGEMQVSIRRQDLDASGQHVSVDFVVTNRSAVPYCGDVALQLVAVRSDMDAVDLLNDKNTAVQLGELISGFKSASVENVLDQGTSTIARRATFKFAKPLSMEEFWSRARLPTDPAASFLLGARFNVFARPAAANDRAKPSCLS